ncbi:hypothetical protein AB0J86_19790 [Micromonospora sp. NPDC049559]|uniref:hypothetical protein n=1 Tax=Micromonospora sp. NPDC049559 TaxID=3155923 RepID=UPI00342253F1
MSRGFLGTVVAGVFLLVAGPGVALTSTSQGVDVIRKIGPGVTRNGGGAAPSDMFCGGNTNTTIRAQNEIESGDVDGGNGGDVAVTLTAPDRAPVSLDLRAGDGGDGGESGEGQGADQAEDLGEYAGQTNPRNSNNQNQTSTDGAGAGAPAGDDVREGEAADAPSGAAGSGATCDGTGANSDTSIDAVNNIFSGSADGGHGGDVSVTLTAPDRAPVSLNLRAGDGGDGGESGAGQGADQAEDLGEYAGQTNPRNSNNQIQTSTGDESADASSGDEDREGEAADASSGAVRSGVACGGTDGNSDTSIDAVNGISSGSASGGNGGNIYLIINAS